MYASWNGATEVALASGGRAAAGELEPVQTKAKKAFETSLAVPSSAGFAVAVALDARGRVLGRSNRLRQM